MSKRPRHFTEPSPLTHYKISMRRAPFLSPSCRPEGSSHFPQGTQLARGRAGMLTNTAAWLSGQARNHILVGTQQRGFVS